MLRPIPSRALALPVVLLTAACILRSPPRAEPITEPVSVDTPVKAHLLDGSVVVFSEGATYARDSLRGPAVQYDLGLALVGSRSAVPLDSLLGVETITGGTNVGSSVAVSVLAAGVGVAAGSALAVAIFGSCPTVYASTSPDAPMEAELFSHSIVPLAEARDVDRLAVSGDRERVVLDIRNEALETHFINHLELLAVEHSADEWVVNDPSGLPLAVGGFVRPTRVRTRDGRDVHALLSDRDSVFFGTDESRLARADADDFEDHLEIEVPRPAGDSAAVVLRLRNSLLNTVLLYDFMLGRAGLEAADWLGGTLERLGTAVEMGRWYQSRMGMRVEVEEEGVYRPAGRMSDTGPLAWEDVALVVPVPKGEDVLRIRLSFLADQWRVDQLRVAGSVRRPALQAVPLARILRENGEAWPEAWESARAPDDRYLQTTPGTVVQAVFETGPASTDRTFLLAAQGYYTEWLRPAWIRAADPPRPFVASDAVLVEALDRWREVKPEMEERFYAARIPTR